MIRERFRPAVLALGSRRSDPSPSDAELGADNLRGSVGFVPSAGWDRRWQAALFPATDDAASTESPEGVPGQPSPGQPDS
jgi:hypothetical protein